MVALPFCHFEFRAKKPLPRAFPRQLATLGDHLRLTRLKSNLTQSEAARAMGVDEMTLVGWELNRHAVSVVRIPAVIRFLGYVPEDLFPARTASERLRRYRVLHGLTRRVFAARLGIDEGTLSRFEEGKGRHNRKIRENITRFLTSLGQPGGHDRI